MNIPSISQPRLPGILVAALLLVFTALPALAVAQEFDTLTAQLWSFGDNVRVREKPGLDAKVVCKLQAGEEVTTISFTRNPEEYFTLNRQSYPWVEVRTHEGKEGYVWAGMLAHYATHDTFPGWGEGLLMLSPLLTDSSGNWAFRQVQNNRITHELVFSDPVGFMMSDHAWIPFEYRSTEVEIMTPEGFHPTLTWVDIAEEWCGCGCAVQHTYFTWNGKSLQHAFSRGEEFSPYLIDDFSIHFPEEGETENQARVVQRYAKPREGEDEAHEEDAEITEEIYKWDGTRLVKEH
jgi:hypothetical protein